MASPTAQDITPGPNSELIENGWFMEKNSQWPGQANSLRVKRVLVEKQTDFQDLMVFESTDWGNVLVLDGVIQLTERDEMSYQEMMAHLPLFSCAEPRHVLIIGGGDGGVLREVCKHSCVEHVTMCEIDGGVVQASKDFFPSVSCAFTDPRVNLMIGDGVAFAENSEDASFDVMIVDSSDPVGPAEKLFSKEFYVNAHRILKPGGVICSQIGSVWLDKELIASMLSEHGSPFATAEYASIQVPTYPSGQLGAFLARRGEEPGTETQESTCRRRRRAIPDGMELRYYSEDMHVAAFALPAFLKTFLSGQASETRLGWA